MIPGLASRVSRLASWRGTERRAADWVVVVAWGIGVTATGFWFFTAARQALPVFDDFCRASFHPTTEFRPAELPSGFWSALSWSYQNWSGRWAGTALGMLVLGTANIETFYPLVLALTMAVYVALTVVAARRYFGASGLLLTGLVWMTYWSSAPGFSEVFFWSTTSIEAHAGLVLAALVWSHAATSDLRRWPTILVLCIGAFVVGGLHEVAGILFCGCLAWRVLYLAVHDRRALPGWAWIAACAIAGTAVSVFAPGNGVRATLYPASGALLPSLMTAAKQGAASAKSWFLADPRWWMAALVVLSSAWLRHDKSREAARALGRNDALWFAAAIVTTLAVAFAAPALALGGEMAGRTVAQLYFFMVIVGIGGLAAVALPLLGEGDVSGGVLRTVRVVAAAIFCLSVALEGNGRLVRREASAGTLSRWHEQQSLRIRLLRAASIAGETTVVLPRIVEQSAVLPVVRDSSDPDYAHNLCLEWYYGIERVSTE
jgi:hypothetical protein